MGQSLRIDIVSDVVCPWCVIGYLQLQKALATLPSDVTVNLHWQPFELNPQMPAEGQDLREHLMQKYGPSAGRGNGARKQLTDLGLELGFEFNYHANMRMVNTFKAHQLLHWAAQQGVQTELKMALFTAFFTNSQDVSQNEVLLSAAKSVGLSESGASEVLSSERYAAAVRAEQKHWLEKDVHAVPAFSFNDAYPLPGAQGETTFARYLTKVLAA